MRVSSSFIDQAISGLEKNRVWIGWDKKFIVVKKDSLFLRVIKYLLGTHVNSYSFIDSKMVLEKLRKADWTFVDESKKKRFFLLFNRATNAKYREDINHYLESDWLNEEERIQEAFFFVRDYGQFGYIDDLGRIVRLVWRDGTPCLRILLSEDEVVVLHLYGSHCKPCSLLLERGRFIPYKAVQKIIEDVYQKSLKERHLGEMFSRNLTNQILFEKKKKSFELGQYFFNILDNLKESECLTDITIKREKEYKCLIRKVGEKNLIFEIRWKNKLQASPLILRDELWSLDLTFPLDDNKGEEPHVIFSSKYQEKEIEKILPELQFIIKSLYEKIADRSF